MLGARQLLAPRLSLLLSFFRVLPRHVGTIQLMPPAAQANPAQIQFAIVSRASTRLEILGHKNLIVVPAVLLQRLLFDSIFHKAEPEIEPPSRMVLAHHAQLDQFNMLAGKFNHSLSQPLPYSGLS